MSGDRSYITLWTRPEGPFVLAQDHSAILEIHRSQQVRDFEAAMLRQPGGLESLAQVYSRLRLLDQSQESIFKRNIATKKRIPLDRCPEVEFIIHPEVEGRPANQVPPWCIVAPSVADEMERIPHTCPGYIDLRPAPHASGYYVGMDGQVPRKLAERCDKSSQVLKRALELSVQDPHKVYVVFRVVDSLPFNTHHGHLGFCLRLHLPRDEHHWERVVTGSQFLVLHHLPKVSHQRVRLSDYAEPPEGSLWEVLPSASVPTMEEDDALEAALRWSRSDPLRPQRRTRRPQPRSQPPSTSATNTAPATPQYAGGEVLPANSAAPSAAGPVMIPPGAPACFPPQIPAHLYPWFQAGLLAAATQGEGAEQWPSMPAGGGGAESAVSSEPEVPVSSSNCSAQIPLESPFVTTDVLPQAEDGGGGGEQGWTGPDLETLRRLAGLGAPGGVETSAAAVDMATGSSSAGTSAAITTTTPPPPPCLLSASPSIATMGARPMVWNGVGVGDGSGDPFLRKRPRSEEEDRDGTFADEPPGKVPRGNPFADSPANDCDA